MNKFTVLRKVDKNLGNAFIRILSVRKKTVKKPDPKKILLIKLFGFGNFIFLAPTIRDMRLAFPHATIDVLTFSNNAKICQMYPKLIDNLHTIKFSIASMSVDIPKFILTHRGEYDIIIDFEQFIRLSAIIGRLSNPRMFLGIATKESKKAAIYDKNIEYKENMHVVEEYHKVAEYLESIYHVPKTDAIRPIRLIKPITTRKDLKFKNPKMKTVGICMGGRIDDVERRYPKEKSVEFLKKLVKKDDIQLVFFGSKEEKDDIRWIISRLKGYESCVDVSGMPLNESAYLISKCDVFISNDTGPLHLAAALGVFCVGLYGPSKEWIYGPYTDKKIILRDKKHAPIRSNHNEKDTGWNEEWWPSPQKIYKEVSRILQRR